MAGNARPSFAKRQKEMERLQRQKEKVADRAQRKEAKIARATEPGSSTEEDPDIAGITPGPQAPLF